MNHNADHFLVIAATTSKTTAPSPTSYSKLVGRRTTLRTHSIEDSQATHATATLESSNPLSVHILVTASIEASLTNVFHSPALLSTSCMISPEDRRLVMVPSLPTGWSQVSVPQDYSLALASLSPKNDLISAHVNQAETPVALFSEPKLTSCEQRDLNTSPDDRFVIRSQEDITVPTLNPLLLMPPVAWESAAVSMLDQNTFETPLLPPIAVRRKLNLKTKKLEKEVIFIGSGNSMETLAPAHMQTELLETGNLLAAGLLPLSPTLVLSVCDLHKYLICVYVNINIFVHAYISTQIYIHTHTHTYIYI